MAETKNIAIKNSEIVNIKAALDLLASRTLPSLNAELKIAKLARHMKPYFEDYDAIRTKYIKEHTKSTEDGESKMRDAAGLQSKINDLLNTEVEIVEPTARVKKDDLPQTLKGEGGEKNREGVAAALLNLGFLYEETPE